MIAKKHLMNLTIVSLTCVGLAMSSATFGKGGPSSSEAPVVITPTAGIAAVDGDTEEWNQSADSADFAAKMYEAGNSSKDLLSNLYIRYDCSTKTAYVLVMAVEGQWPHKDDNAWVKLYNVANSAVVFSEFKWVGPDEVEGESLRGYEAAFSVDPGTTYDMETHIQIIKDRTSSTGKKANPVQLIIPSECDTTPPAEVSSCDYIYGVHDAGLNNSHIFRVNPTTLVFEDLGSPCMGCDIEGLDISPDGKLYGSSGDDTDMPGALYEIDMDTGVRVMIGDPSGLEIDGISFNPVTSQLTGWAQDEGLLSINAGSGAVTVGSPSNGEIEDLTWANNGTTIYFILNDHPVGVNPDAGKDDTVGQKLMSYDNDVLANVCDIGGEIEALEVLQDGNLLVGYHDKREQLAKVVDPVTCTSVDYNVPVPYTDIEGLAVCPTAEQPSVEAAMAIVTSNEYPPTPTEYLSVSVNSSQEQDILNYDVAVTLSANAPTDATDVMLKVTLPEDVELQSINTDYGMCDTSNLPVIACYLTDLSVANPDDISHVTVGIGVVLKNVEPI